MYCTSYIISLKTEFQIPIIVSIPVPAWYSKAPEASAMWLSRRCGEEGKCLLKCSSSENLLAETLCRVASMRKHCELTKLPDQTWASARVRHGLSGNPGNPANTHTHIHSLSQVRVAGLWRQAATCEQFPIRKATKNSWKTPQIDGWQSLAGTNLPSIRGDSRQARVNERERGTEIVREMESER